MNEPTEGPCPFLTPEGPEGTDLETALLQIDEDTRIPVAAGSVLFIDEDRATLKKLKRLKNGGVWGMVEFEDKSILWTALAPEPTPPLTHFQEEEIESIKTRLSPLHMLRRKVGDRVGCGDGRTGTIVLMAFRESFTGGTIVAVDDGSIQISDNVAQLLREMDELKGKA